MFVKSNISTCYYIFMCFVEEVYPGAEIIVGDEDTQPLETPIIAPIKAKTYSQVEKKLPSTTFDFKFLAG